MHCIFYLAANIHFMYVIVCMLRCQWRSFKLHVNHFILNGLWPGIYYFLLCLSDERSSIVCRLCVIVLCFPWNSKFEVNFCSSIGMLLTGFPCLSVRISLSCVSTHFLSGCCCRRCFFFVNHFNFYSTTP